MVDSGSTHNFLNKETALKLGCFLKPLGRTRVLVANGHQLPCASMCEGFEWKAQGQVFKVDAYVLSLENYDLILGTQWLAILRDIL